MNYRTCYGSICECGEKIDIIKSGIQKYLRRREAEKMKRMMKELVLFKFMAKNEKEEKIGKAIFSNMINRIIVMLDEELSFDEINRFLKVREIIDKIKMTNNLNNCLTYVYNICDILCSGRLCRLNSDIVCYFNKRIFEYGERIEEVEIENNNSFDIKKGDSTELINNMNCFINCFERRDERLYYYLFKIFNMEEQTMTARYGRKDAIYVCIKWIESRIKDDKIREVFKYKLESFYDKAKKERKMFLVGLLNIVYYEDDIDLLEEVGYNVSGVIEDIVIDDYIIDMHCSKGRKMGLNTAKFAEEGSLVINEYVKYKNNLWRDYYNNDKMNNDKGKEKGKKKNVVEEKKNVGEKKKKNVREEEKNVEEKNVEEKNVEEKKVVIKVKKIRVKKEKIVVVEEEKEKEEKKEKKVVKKVVKKVGDELIVNDMGLEEISMDKFEFMNICKHTICGSKVQCFMVKYEGKIYVMKEGRKSMLYNKDYDMVDKCKEIFGLKAINMRRIISDKILDKDGNFIEKRAIYSMMEVIDGIKLIDYRRKNGEKSLTDKIMREYVKIGCWRGIFMVSDFNVTNVFINENTGELVSMDEHDMGGKRTEIFGSKNKKYLLKYKDSIDSILDDLMSNYEEKKEWIKRIVSEYNYDENIYNMIINNFDSLRDRVYAEINKK